MVNTMHPHSPNNPMGPLTLQVYLGNTSTHIGPLGWVSTHLCHSRMVRRMSSARYWRCPSYRGQAAILLIRRDMLGVLLHVYLVLIQLSLICNLTAITARTQALPLDAVLVISSSAQCCFYCTAGVSAASVRSSMPFLALLHG